MSRLRLFTQKKLPYLCDLFATTEVEHSQCAVCPLYSDSTLDYQCNYILPSEALITYLNKTPLGKPNV